MNNADEFLWTQKYRPQKIEDCVLPDATKTMFQEFVNRKEIPNLILTGTAGVGKTTSALALCKEIGCDHLIINGSNETGIDLFRSKITNYATSVSLKGGRKVIIIDEADYMNPLSLQPALRHGIESFSKNATFIFTVNYVNKIIDPIRSRCSIVNFSISKSEKEKIIKTFFKRICNILDIEQVEYNKEVIATILMKYYPDFRKVINDLQRYSITGKIDSGILTQSGEFQFKNLFASLREKNFTKMREWVSQNTFSSDTDFYRKFYDTIFDLLKPSYIPQLILTLSKYQYQTNFVADPEIQILSFLVEVMVDIEFKHE